MTVALCADLVVSGGVDGNSRYVIEGDVRVYIRNSISCPAFLSLGQFITLLFLARAEILPNKDGTIIALLDPL